MWRLRGVDRECFVHRERAVASANVPRLKTKHPVGQVGHARDACAEEAQSVLNQRQSERLDGRRWRHAKRRALEHAAKELLHWRETIARAV